MIVKIDGNGTLRAWVEAAESLYLKYREGLGSACVCGGSGGCVGPTEFHMNGQI